MASKKRDSISKIFKHEVAIEYLQGGEIMKELAFKFNLPTSKVYPMDKILPYSSISSK